MRFIVGMLLLLLMLPGAAAAFDHGHGRWDGLLREHVVWNEAGTASSIDYAALEKDHGELRAYLAELSAVTKQEYRGWSREQQLAFLINAYNAYTAQLIVDAYPLESIRELGSILRSVWEKTFFSLLGKKQSLDGIEHGMLRAAGIFDEPLIHVAINCASIGCPALQQEAFTAGRLEEQLQDSLRRFLSDRSRNRFDAASGTLEVSSIFKWFEKDFSAGHRGYTSLAAFFSRHADLLGADEQGRRLIAAGRAKIRFLKYDWDLNDLPRE